VRALLAASGFSVSITREMAVTGKWREWLEAFPYGKAPLWILVVAVVSGGLGWALAPTRQAARADLRFVIFARTHAEMYREAIPRFEQRHNCRVHLQLVSDTAVKSRLQAALLTGAEVPDVVEILNPTIGYFTRGPLADVGFVDLTDRLHREGIYDQLVESRYSLWSSRGRIFALPHDVHPVTLCYRRDLFEQLGEDAGKLQTWDDFVAFGRRVTKDLNGDGVPDRYALDLSPIGGDLQTLLLQRDEGLFDPQGRVRFDTPGVAETIIWYIHQTHGPQRISFGAGWGQNFVKAVTDGLVLAFICPDWRTKMAQVDMPHLAGKLALMPLPAWTPGGRRTSTWGGTGLAITKACRRQELAWEFAKFLYLERADLGRRYSLSNIIPPVKAAWNLPEFEQPYPFFGGQPIGQLLAGLAPTTPADYVGPYTELAGGKLSEAFLNAAAYYKVNGDTGLREFTEQELKKATAYVRQIQARNVFLRTSP
jgi:arabinosaccharide transport system substrate-binding protein